MHLGQGVIHGIRNRTVHEPASAPTSLPIDEAEGLHYIKTISTFARWIDQANVKDARGRPLANRSVEKKGQFKQVS